MRSSGSLSGLFILIRGFAGNIRNSKFRICRRLHSNIFNSQLCICLQSNYLSATHTAVTRLHSLQNLKYFWYLYLNMICCVVPASRPRLRMKLILTYCHPCLYFRRNLTLLENLNFLFSTSEKIDLSSELIDVVNHVVQYIFSRNIFQFSLRIIVHIEAF